MHDKTWLKRVLIPFWTIELLWLIGVVAFSSIGVYEIEEYENEYQSVVSYRTVSISAILLLAMGGLSIILDIVAIVLFARHKLNPIPYLIMSCIKAVFWTFIFVMDIADAARGFYTGLAFLFSTVLFGTSVGQLAYGSVIMHRKRNGVYARGYYAGVEGGATKYRAAGYESPPRGSYAGYNPHGAAPNPFKDPSREPSPVRQRSVVEQEPVTASHPAFRKSGEAESY